MSRLFLLIVSLTAFQSPLIANGQIVQFRSEATNTLGEMISSISAGQDFFFNVHVQDIRSKPRGVFSAFVDVVYDDSLFIPSGEIVYGERFPNFQQGDLSMPGLIDEAGAVDGIDEYGGEEVLLFSVPMRSLGAKGTGLFALDSADMVPPFETTVYGLAGIVLPEDQLMLNTDLTVIPEPSGKLLLNALLALQLLIKPRRRARLGRHHPVEIS